MDASEKDQHILNCAKGYQHDSLKKLVMQLDCFGYPQVPLPIVRDASVMNADLPLCNGVYFVWRSGEIIYVGKSSTLKNRCRLAHPCIAIGDGISWIQFAESEVSFAECFYIAAIRPVLNFRNSKKIEDEYEEDEPEEEEDEHQEEEDENEYEDDSPGDGDYDEDDGYREYMMTREDDITPIGAFHVQVNSHEEHDLGFFIQFQTLATNSENFLEGIQSNEILSEALFLSLKKACRNIGFIEGAQCIISVRYYDEMRILEFYDIDDPQVAEIPKHNFFADRYRAICKANRLEASNAPE